MSVFSHVWYEWLGKLTQRIAIDCVFIVFVFIEQYLTLKYHVLHHIVLLKYIAICQVPVWWLVTRDIPHIPFLPSISCHKGGDAT